MILTSKKARRAVAVLGSAAVIAGLALPAPPAGAVGITLAFGPTPTSATIVNVDPTLSAGNAALSYGLKVTGATLADADPLRLSVLTGPSTPAGAALYAERIPANGTPTANLAGTPVTGAGVALTPVTVTGSAGGTTLTKILASDAPAADLAGYVVKVSKAGEPTEIAEVVSDAGLTITLDRKLIGAHSGAALTALGSGIDPYATTAVGTSAPVLGYSTGTADNIYFGAVVPGTYTFQLYKDRNSTGVYEPLQDDTTPTFTLTVKDVTGTSVITTDDLAFGLTVPATVDLGRAVPASSEPGLSTLDTRGLDAGHGNVGALGYAIAQATTFTFAGTSGHDTANNGIPTFDGTAFTRTSGVVASAGTTTTTPTLTFTGGPYTGAASTTTATNNLVTALTLVPASGQTANVKISTTAATLRPGTSAVTYTATATVSSGVESGKVVWFSLVGAGGIAYTDLTANGSPVPSTGEVSATTDADGVATLVVTSAKTVNGNLYVVQAESNHVKSDNDTATVCIQSAAAYILCDPVTATYTSPAGASIVTSGSASATLSSTVTITGVLKDQWAQVFKPASGVQATLDVDQGDNSSFGDYTHTVGIAADGTFSSTYSDSTLAAPRTDAYRWTVSSINYAGGHIAWVASVTPATATLTSLNTVALPQAATVTETPANHLMLEAVPLVALVQDASDTALRYVDFTLTGTAGVYFLDGDGKLQTTLAARTNGVGQIQAAADQSGTSVSVVFTKSGTATITLTAGSVTGTSGPITVADSSDPYTIVVNDAAGEPDSVVIVTGAVTDMFGNVVPNVDAVLSVGTSTIGALGSQPVTTNDAGVFSTTFTAGVNKTGIATLTGTLVEASTFGLQAANPAVSVASSDLQIENATPGPVWAAAGLSSLPDGDYQDTGTITIGAPAPPSVTLVAPAGRVGVGSVGLHGVSSTKGMPVDIYAKAAGTNHTLMWINTVVANSTTGVYSAVERISGSTTFVARTATASSPAKTVAVISTVRWGGSRVIGHHRVLLRADGGPGGAGVLSFYNTVGSQLVRIRSIRTDRAGVQSMIWQTTPGFKRVVAVYTAPGCAPSARVSAPFRVR